MEDFDAGGEGDGLFFGGVVGFFGKFAGSFLLAEVEVLEGLGPFGAGGFFECFDRFFFLSVEVGEAAVEFGDGFFELVDLFAGFFACVFGGFVGVFFVFLFFLGFGACFVLCFFVLGFGLFLEVFE